MITLLTEYLKIDGQNKGVFSNDFLITLHMFVRIQDCTLDWYMYRQNNCFILYHKSLPAILPQNPFSNYFCQCGTINRKVRLKTLGLLIVYMYFVRECIAGVSTIGSEGIHKCISFKGPMLLLFALILLMCA